MEKIEYYYEVQLISGLFEDYETEEEAIKEADKLEEPALVIKYWYIEDKLGLSGEDKVIYTNEAYKKWRTEEMRKRKKEVE